jgi:hypothetical protein
MLDQDSDEPLFASTSRLYTWYSIGEGKAAEV